MVVMVGGLELPLILQNTMALRGQAITYIQDKQVHASKFNMRMEIKFEKMSVQWCISFTGGNLFQLIIGRQWGACKKTNFRNIWS